MCLSAFEHVEYGNGSRVSRLAGRSFPQRSFRFRFFKQGKVHGWFFRIRPCIIGTGKHGFRGVYADGRGDFSSGKNKSAGTPVCSKSFRQAQGGKNQPAGCVCGVNRRFRIFDYWRLAACDCYRMHNTKEPVIGKVPLSCGASTPGIRE